MESYYADTTLISARTVLRLGRHAGWHEFGLSARRVQRVRVETRIAAPNAAGHENPSVPPFDGLKALSLPNGNG
jgi:hypothetical protein